MTKQKKEKAPWETQIAVRLPPELVRQIDGFVRTLNESTEPGVRQLTRSDAVRLLLSRALPQQK
jgi:hypothetical protein